MTTKSKMNNKEEVLLTEVPSSLKQLARLVVRGFYTIEDSLIIDMLVRNPCMKEDDICDLLKFDKKMLRARITSLKNDKFIQSRNRLETGSDGKAQKVNYYFINYKTFVNVVKYKLDIMRKKLETEERDATSRASFKCTSCSKTFTDLEADLLFDMTTGDFRCTYCTELVEEDKSALPKQDSRLMLAKFNEQLQPLYTLLQEVEGIKLAPEVLEPEPTDINAIRGSDNKKPNNNRGPLDQWSGEATRSSGFAVEDTRVDVLIGDEIVDNNKSNQRKERPIWLMESTVITQDSTQTQNNPDSVLEKAAAAASNVNTNKQGDDIMSVLLAHEKKGSTNATAVKGLLHDESGSSEESNDMQAINTGEVETMDSDDDEDVPLVSVNGKRIAITDIDDAVIKEMSAAEKDAYIQIYQEYYSSMYD
ncbi:general transcription factor IIE subunit 1 [Trichogramma pretiosum]|uniref:general transcription factor IIE subunit 1 n=1 Tax=Trichogramma pretiosum TaxID=7493 RepID=UPI0006C983DC|nr:general transcription factor IIE subunit 1 [Trichogramma pretiosum]